MKNLILAAAFGCACTAPAFAQDAAAIACLEYSKLDNAKQMAVIAALDSATSEMGGKLTADQIYAGLSTECTAHPDKLVSDAVKELKKM